MLNTRDEAMALLRQYNKEPFHILHALTVEGVMAWYANELGYGERGDFWSMVGLLHDIDFEQWPDQHCQKAPELLREAGAREVHLRVSAPPFLNPCYYGTDIDSRENLIACHHNVEEIARIIGVDSLGYLPVEQLGALIGQAHYCGACFTGLYPTPVPVNTRKDRFEQKLSEKNAITPHQ